MQEEAAALLGCARARCGATSTGTTRAARRADRQADGADVVAAGAGGLDAVPGEVRADVGVPRPAPPLLLRSRRLVGRHRMSADKTLRAFRGLCPESPKYMDTGAKGAARACPAAPPAWLAPVCGLSASGFGAVDHSARASCGMGGNGGWANRTDDVLEKPNKCICYRHEPVQALTISGQSSIFSYPLRLRPSRERVGG